MRATARMEEMRLSLFLAGVLLLSSTAQASSPQEEEGLGSNLCAGWNGPSRSPGAPPALHPQYLVANRCSGKVSTQGARHTEPFGPVVRKRPANR